MDIFVHSLQIRYRNLKKSLTLYNSNPTQYRLYCSIIISLLQVCKSCVDWIDVLSVHRTARAASEDNNIPDLSYKCAFFVKLYWT